LIASLSVVFAALATVMAALGLYGVMAFTVARRTKEIGLRTALGAQPVSVLWMVMREVLSLLGVGLIAGVPYAFLLSRFVASTIIRRHADRSLDRYRGKRDPGIGCGSLRLCPCLAGEYDRSTGGSAARVMGDEYPLTLRFYTPLTATPQRLWSRMRFNNRRLSTP
jgi:ABC-type antimicrobial peptide transport system permease subunit